MGKITHGHNKKGRRTTEYNTWLRMRERCEKENHPQYPDYGGRGIKVCDRWLIFANFLADMGLKPSPDLSIDRIDNDRGYEPGNCRWATEKEQQNNRRPRKICSRGIDLMIYGRVWPVRKWSNISGTPPRTIYGRYYKGWPHKECVFGKST